MERYLKFLPPSYDDYYESDMFLFSVVEILCQLHNQYMLTFCVMCMVFVSKNMHVPYLCKGPIHTTLTMIHLQYFTATF